MRKKSKTKLLLMSVIVLVLVALPLLGACTRDVPVEKLVEKEVIKEVPVEKVVIKEVEPVRPEGELRIAFGALGTQNLDPVLSAHADRFYLHLIYDSLVGGATDGSLSTETGVAKEWETSPDGMTWTFRLREGIKFHNGDDLTAEDAKFSLERCTAPGSVAAGVGLLRDAIDKIEVADSYRLVLHLKQPTPTLPYYLAFLTTTCGVILPKGYIETYGEDNFIANPIGSGPYRVDDQVRDVYLLLEAMEEHWRVGIPQYETVRYMMVPELTSRLAMLQRGAAHVADISRERVPEAKAAGLNVFFKKAEYEVVLWFMQQWEDGPLHSVKVREALNLGINREEILEHIFAGMGEVINTFLGYSYSYADTEYDPTPDVYTFDPARAKALIAEDFPGGISLDLVSMARPGAPEGAELVEAVAAQWEKIGNVKVNIVPMDWGTVAGQWSTQKLPGAKTVVWFPSGNRGPGPVAFGAVNAVLRSSSPYRFVEDAEMDGIIQAYNIETNLEKAKELHHQALQMTRDKHLGIAVVGIDGPYAASTEITEWDLGKRAYDQNLEYLFTR